MRVWGGWVWAVALLWAVGVSAQSASPGGLVIVWPGAEGVVIWREGDGTTEVPLPGALVQDVRLAPDGERVAVLAADADGETLWFTTEGAAVPLVTTAALDGGLFGQVAWADDVTLYFNTLRGGSAVGATPENDLWRVDVTTATVEQVLAAGVGGAFAVSPNRQQIAVATPGTFNQSGEPDAEGAVRLYDVASGDVQIVLGHTAIASGSPQPFYPRLNWLADSSAFYTAIPQPDLLYNPDAETRLWRVAVAGPPENVGVLAADYFGGPRWNADGTQLVYGARVSEGLQLTLADATGADQRPIGTATDRYLFAWSPEGTAFLWGTGDGAAYYVGTPAAPQRLPLAEGDLRLARWLADGRLLLGVPDGPTQTTLRLFSGFDGDNAPVSELIQGGLPTGLPLDAVVVPPGA